MYNPFWSKTNWSLIAIIILTGVQAEVPFMPASWQAVVTAILGLAAVVFHTTTAVKAGAINTR